MQIYANDGPTPLGSSEGAINVCLWTVGLGQGDSSLHHVLWPTVPSFPMIMLDLGFPSG